MGAAHSRRKPGAGGPTCAKLTLGANHPPPRYGNFILSLKTKTIKVVNAESAELKLLTSIIKKHCQLLKEGWDRNLTYSYKLKESGGQCLIQLVAETLMSLYQLGWEPMTPIEMRLKRLTVDGGLQTEICFRKKDIGGELGSTYSLLTQRRESNEDENSCLCLELSGGAYLGLHNVPNTALHELVKTIQAVWAPGIRGVSMGVASVIQDYSSNMPSVLPASSHLLPDKFVVLEGDPWSSLPMEGGADLEDAKQAEQLQVGLIACLSKEGYKLSMDINMEENTRVFFLIKSMEDNRAEVRVPNNAGAGLGEKETLSVYRPMLIRHKSSFFRSYHGKTASVRNRIRASLRRSAMNRQGRQDTVMSYKIVGAEPAWWQQASTDASRDKD